MIRSYTYDVEVLKNFFSISIINLIGLNNFKEILYKYWVNNLFIIDILSYFAQKKCFFINTKKLDKQ